MSTINNTPAIPALGNVTSLGNDKADSADGGINGIDDGTFSLQDLLVEYEKLCAKNRETLQQAATDQKVASHNHMKSSYETKMESIGEEYNAGIARAVTQIVSGAGQVLGSAGGTATANATGGLGKTGEGIAGVASEGMLREAKEGHLEAEFEEKVANENSKSASEYDQQMAQVRRDLAEVARSVGQLYAQLAQAVKY